MLTNTWAGFEQQSVWRPHYQVWQNFLWWNFFFVKTRVFLLRYCIHTLSFCVVRVNTNVRLFHSDPVEGNAQLPPDQALAWAVRQQEYRCQNRQRRRWSHLQQELCPPETRARLATSLEGEEDVYSAPVISLMWSSSNLNIFVSGCSTEGEAVLVGDWHVSL